MKKATAKTKYVRISPFKARLAANLIRGLNVEDALIQLKFSPLKGARLILKTLNSAIANAETNLDAKREGLKVDEIKIDEGPTIKRARPRSRGGRVPELKRTSHFTVVLSNKGE